MDCQRPTNVARPRTRRRFVSPVGTSGRRGRQLTAASGKSLDQICHLEARPNIRSCRMTCAGSAGGCAAVVCVDRVAGRFVGWFWELAPEEPPPPCAPVFRLRLLHHCLLFATWNKVLRERLPDAAECGRGP